MAAPNVTVAAAAAAAVAAEEEISGLVRGLVTRDLLLKAAAAGRQARRKGESSEDFLGRLTHLDLSGRALRRGLGCLGRFMAQSLRVLYLYDNALEGLEGLGSARGLTHLYLQNNGLESLAGVGALPGLQKLYADGNRLAEVAGLEGCGQLEELHVSGQRLGASPGAAVRFDYACMAALGRSLQVLAVQGCGLADGHVGVFGLLPRLERLDLQNNRVEGPAGAGLEAMLGGCRSLRELRLQGNPLCRSKRFLEDVVAMATPRLEEVDNHRVTAKQREFVLRFKMHKLKRANSKGSPSPGPREGPALGKAATLDRAVLRAQNF